MSKTALDVYGYEEEDIVVMIDDGQRVPAFVPNKVNLVGPHKFM